MIRYPKFPDDPSHIDIRGTNNYRTNSFYTLNLHILNVSIRTKFLAKLSNLIYNTLQENEDIINEDNKKREYEEFLRLKSIYEPKT